MSTTDQKTTYWLEMGHADELRPTSADNRLEIRRVEIACHEYNWFLHQAVGEHHRWGGRELWGRDEWRKYVDRPELETHVGYVGGAPAGYYELEKQPEGSVRIECFGLLPQFIGKGLGGPLLTAAVQRCWEMGATRVWLTTCSHDHPHALTNYLARGFRQFDQTEAPPNRPRETGLFRSPEFLD